MKHVKSAAITLLLFAMAAVAQQGPGNATSPNVPKNMKKYFVLFLVRSSAQTAGDAAIQDQVRQAHIAFIRKMVESGKYAIAGPFLDRGAIVGVIIANAQSEDEARNWESADPLVTAEGLKVEVHPAMLPSLDSVKVEY